MTEHPPPSGIRFKALLARRWKLLLVLLALFVLDVALSLHIGSHGDPRIYWLYILDESEFPFYFCAVMLVAAMGGVIIPLWRKVKWYLYPLLIIAYLLPLPLGIFGHFMSLSSERHVTSGGFCGRVYHVSDSLLSGTTYHLYECDRVGLVCQWVDSQYTIGSLPTSTDDLDSVLYVNGNDLSFASRPVRVCTLDGPRPVEPTPEK
jgi:hypothetical protein